MAGDGRRTRRVESIRDGTSRCESCGRERPEASTACPWCGLLDQPRACARHRNSMAFHQCAVCGTGLCSDCRRGKRRTALCEEHEQVRLISGWAEAARSTDEVEAEVLASRLRGAHVDVQVFSQKDHANVVSLGALALVRVLVPVFQLQEARRILAAEIS